MKVGQGHRAGRERVDNCEGEENATEYFYTV